MEMESIITGRCEIQFPGCSETGVLQENPYDADVNNEIRLQYICESCRDALCKEI
jgi:hypothetical protein